MRQQHLVFVVTVIIVTVSDSSTETSCACGLEFFFHLTLLLWHFSSSDCYSLSDFDVQAQSSAEKLKYLNNWNASECEVVCGGYCII